MWYSLAARHLLLRVGELFADRGVFSLPEAVDFVGPTDGTVFVRQAQLRYTTGNFSLAWKTRTPRSRRTWAAPRSCRRTTT